MRARGQLTQAPVVLALLSGCTGPLLGDERVIPGEVPVDIRYGPPASELGTSLAWRDGVVLATSPGTGTLTIGTGTLPVAATFVGWWGAHVVYASEDGVASVDGVPTWLVSGATAWAAGASGVAATDGRRLVLLAPHVSVDVAGIRALAMGESRVLALVCDEVCEGRAWALDGTELGRFADGGEGGSIGEWAGVAWVGDPQWETPDGAGMLSAETGEHIHGEVGDHFGAAVGGGYAAGTFNKWIVPARARIVPLDGGDTYAMEQGAEDQPLTLAGDGATLVIGAPFYPRGTQPTGALLTLSLGD